MDAMLPESGVTRSASERLPEDDMVFDKAPGRAWGFGILGIALLLGTLLLICSAVPYPQRISFVVQFTSTADTADAGDVAAQAATRGGGVSAVGLVAGETGERLRDMPVRVAMTMDDAADGMRETLQGRVVAVEARPDRAALVRVGFSPGTIAASRHRHVEAGGFGRGTIVLQTSLLQTMFASLLSHFDRQG